MHTALLVAGLYILSSVAWSLKIFSNAATAGAERKGLLKLSCFTGFFWPIVLIRIVEEISG